VTPVFMALIDRDPTGTEWLAELLALPERVATPERIVTPPMRPERMRFGSDEAALDPPVPLLRWMIQNPTRLSKPKADAKSEVTKTKRKALLSGNLSVQAEALALLDKGAPQQVWYVLEGRSRPDVFIETDDAIIVIEGKRTEPEATTSTSWLANRHQMLRHLDCAWEMRAGRRIYGFFIVESKKSDGSVPKKWRDACDETVSATTLETSLPHRSPADREAIARSFLGATTWQRVRDRFDLDVEGI
jgi:hypothetical protein